MKRRWFWVLGALAIAGVMLGLSLLRHEQDGTSAGAPVEGGGQAFVDDSLGVAMRVPSSKWKLHREAGAPSGRAVNMVHESGRATVAVYIQPARPEADIEALLHRRQERIARVLGVPDLNQVISRVVADTLTEVNEKPVRHWQALTQVIEVPGETPSRAMFMWLVTKNSGRSVEAIGTVRIPAQPKPGEDTETNTLLLDVGYILQSMVVQ